MDGHRFDTLTRSLSTPGSRRHALVAVLGGTVGLLGVHSSWEGFYVFTAAAAEIVCIVAGALLLLPARDSGRSTMFHRRAHHAS